MDFIIGVTWSRGAVSQHFIALGRELSARGHTVTIVTDNHRRVEDPDLEVLAWPSGRPTRLRDARFLLRFVQKRKPDCFIANFSTVNVMTVIGYLRNVPRRIVWYHTLLNALPDSRKWHVYRRRVVLRLATHVIPVSEAAKADVVVNYGISPHRCSVHHLSLSDPGVMTHARDRFLCVGRLHESKGQDVLIRALAHAPGVQVDFIGPGDSRSLRTLAAALGVESRCRFVGLMEGASVVRAMGNGLATVIPSRIDNRPMVAIESLAAGTPLVASRVGGIPEIFRDGIDGYLVTPDDPDELAAKLTGISAAKAEAMGAAGRDYFLEHYEQSKVVATHADWLENLP